MADRDTRVKSFYGGTSKRTNRSWEIKKIKVEKCASDFRQYPILLHKRLIRIDDPLPVFETFSRQQMAFDFAGTCHQDVHVFAKEKDSLGKRVYIVATLPAFWYMYTRACSPEDRNYYEVIPEGAACRLYFDLEFKTEINLEKDGTKMLEIFIKYVCQLLKEMYGINCDRRFIVDLDSSTSFKFSRHLIFHLPGAVFKDNIHVGNFVRHICALWKTKLGFGSEMCCKQPSEKDVLSQVCNDDPHAVVQENSNKCNEENTQSLATRSKCDVSSPDHIIGSEGKDQVQVVNLEELRELVINDGKDGFSTFCDQGVYTKNRNFRIFKSTKIGKNSHLIVSSQSTFKPNLKDRKGSFSNDPEYLLFLDSLVSNVSMQVGGKDVEVLTCESCEKSSKTSTWTETQNSSSQVPGRSGYEYSPYVDIDEFILQVVNKGGVQGEIRKWVFFPQGPICYICSLGYQLFVITIGKLLSYDILKNRWCENIGRPHKSNNIMIVVDLRLGVYYQKCHDPDCKSIDYRSPERPIPEEINPLSYAESGEFFESDEDDQDLCNAVAELEKQGYDHAGRACDACSPEKHEPSSANGFSNWEVSTRGSKRSAIQDGVDFDDEVGDEALIEADVQQGDFNSSKFQKTCHKKTVKAQRKNGGGECLENGNEVLTQASVHSESALSEKASLERSQADDNLDSTFDDDVSACFDDDPISDLEMSFAAEEVENRK